MRTAVIVFPGSNCDRDLAVAFRRATDIEPVMVWHKETALPDNIDAVGIPGGFSYGDYLRCGAIAAQSPICRAVVDFAERGGFVLGICNGFQILTETGLLPGALMRNAGIKFVCRPVGLTVATNDSPFTARFSRNEHVTIPIAHHDGNYTVAPDELKRLRDEERIAFRYLRNPNGSDDDIAGILSGNRRILGLMPHPERVVEETHGGTDGARLFASMADALIAA